MPTAWIVRGLHMSLLYYMAPDPSHLGAIPVFMASVAACAAAAPARWAASGGSAEVLGIQHVTPKHDLFGTAIFALQNWDGWGLGFGMYMHAISTHP